MGYEFQWASSQVLTYLHSYCRKPLILDTSCAVWYEEEALY